MTILNTYKVLAWIKNYSIFLIELIQEIRLHFFGFLFATTFEHINMTTVVIHVLITGRHLYVILNTVVRV